MLISICFTLRQSGVHSTKNITKPNVIMLTIGKISEGSPIYSTTTPSICAKIGKQELLLVSMRKGAFYSLHAPEVMAGRSRNIIHLLTKQNLAKIRNAEEVGNASTTTVRLTEEMSKITFQLCNKGLGDLWNSKFQLARTIWLLTTLTILKSSCLTMDFHLPIFKSWLKSSKIIKSP